jgi:hypothetical protein
MLARSDAPPLLFPAVKHVPSGQVFAEPHGVHALIAAKACAELGAALDDMLPGYVVAGQFVEGYKMPAAAADLGGRRGGRP